MNMTPNQQISQNNMNQPARPNYYQHYTWVSPRGLVKDARRSTRARGIFPGRMATTRYQLGRTLHYTQDEIMRTTGNFLISAFSMMAIIASVASIVAV